ncbi:MAG: type III polyketide synthase, partial [Bacteroidota bacterium]
MSQPTISALATAVPDNKIEQAEALRFLEHQLSLSERDKRVLRFLYQGTKIESRYSVLPDFSDTSLKVPFFNPDAPPTTAQRMQMYERHALPLASTAIQKLELSKKRLKTITHLITVSCTGMYAPGLDIELVNEIGLSSDVART